MPWCDTCSKFWTPTAMRADGTCPSCGRLLEAPTRKATGAAAGDERDRVPWHFWVLVVAVVAYLGWRLVELVIWAVG